MSNIDEKAKNILISMVRIFEKHEIIKVIDFLRHAETNLGMCSMFKAFLGNALKIGS